MEKFEKYRSDLAEKLKEAPKEVRPAYLEAEKKKPDIQYEQAKALKKDKKGFFELRHTEKLADLNDIKKVAAWFKMELEDCFDRNYGFLMDYKIEDVVRECMNYLIRKKGLSKTEPRDVISAESKTSYDENVADDEGQTRGTVSLFGDEIIGYSSYSDGYGAAIDHWNEQNLEEALSRLLNSSE